MVHLYDFYSLDDVLQHHRGHPLPPPPWQVWVFGLCDTSHTPARGVMRIVPDRSAATLLPIIQQHVRSGTVVHVVWRTDLWAGIESVTDYYCNAESLYTEDVTKDRTGN